MAAQVFLAVAGNIGSGKTTLTRRLVDRFGYQGLYESTTANPYLEDFYDNMRRYALPLQLRFLATRVRETRALVRDGISAIQDRTCYEDADIFAANLHGRGDMDDRDWETYRDVAAQLLAELNPPDVLVYLRRSPESCRSQIRTRGREYEQSMPQGYLEDLHERYERWFDQYQYGRKMLVVAEDHDFLNSEADLDRLVQRIVDAVPQRMLSFGGS
ncbi:MAG: deoxynucleoside kinase [Polyangiales bacterium]|nr:deoxynucleoside kinase [Myxococcales bacterium]